MNDFYFIMQHTTETIESGLLFTLDRWAQLRNTIIGYHNSPTRGDDNPMNSLFLSGQFRLMWISYQHVLKIVILLHTLH